jgi:prevent-host-death family protein
MDSSWPVQDAKARFSEFLEASLKEGPQVVTRRGVEEAVLVPMAEWRRLKQGARPSVKEWLIHGPVLNIPLPPRGQRKHRSGPRF